MPKDPEVTTPPPSAKKATKTSSSNKDIEKATEEHKDTTDARVELSKNLLISFFVSFSIMCNKGTFVQIVVFSKNSFSFFFNLVKILKYPGK